MEMMNKQRGDLSSLGSGGNGSLSPFYEGTSWFLRRICILGVVILSIWNDSHISILAPGPIEHVMVMKPQPVPVNGKQQMLSMTWGNSYTREWETNGTNIPSAIRVKY